MKRDLKHCKMFQIPFVWNSTQLMFQGNNCCARYALHNGILG